MTTTDKPERPVRSGLLSPLLNEDGGQMTFFESLNGAVADASPAVLPDVPEWPSSEKLRYEKEALDFYFSSHPLAQHEQDLLREAEAHHERDEARHERDEARREAGARPTLIGRLRALLGGRRG